MVLWSLSDTSAGFAEIRELVDGLEPLEPPSAWVWNDAAERFGVVLIGDPDDDPPPQIDAVRAFVGGDPTLYEEFDVL